MFNEAKIEQYQDYYNLYSFELAKEDGEKRLVFEGMNGIREYWPIDDIQNMEGFVNLLHVIADGFDAEEMAIVRYNMQYSNKKHPLKEYIEDYEELIHDTYALINHLNEVKIEEDQAVVNMHYFTEHEKQLISGALIAQIGNVSNAMTMIGDTADTSLIESMGKHLSELQELNGKICKCMNE